MSGPLDAAWEELTATWSDVDPRLLGAMRNVFYSGAIAVIDALANSESEESTTQIVHDCIRECVHLTQARRESAR